MEQAVRCPRCRYDLRALSAPRCPECGLAFTWDEWRSGAIRDAAPSRLDHRDPWQPHAMLLAALAELASGVIAPHRPVRRLSLDGPIHTTLWMLVGGLTWAFLLTALVMMLAVAIHANVSPFTAARGAILYAAPRVLAGAVFAATLAFFATGGHATADGTMRPPATVARFAAHSVPVFALHIALPASVLWIADPGLAAQATPFSVYVPALTVGVAAALARRGGGGAWWTHDRVGVVAALVWVFVAPLAATWLAPRALMPPMWVFAP